MKNEIGSGLFFIFDVESIGLHGEGFAVAGGVYNRLGTAQYEFAICCPGREAVGPVQDREWVYANVPRFPSTHATPTEVRTAFWDEWVKAKEKYNGHIQMAGECCWPVEARFLSQCVDDVPTRAALAPYPLLDISSFMQAAGMDPMDTYERQDREKPVHHPLADARLSARLLAEAFNRLTAQPPTL